MSGLNRTVNSVVRKNQQPDLAQLLNRWLNGGLTPRRLHGRWHLLPTALFNQLHCCPLSTAPGGARIRVDNTMLRPAAPTCHGTC